MDVKKVGKFIALNRKKLNMTQSELADKIKVSSKTISRWETGKYMPDISLLIPLSESLNISVQELLLGEYIEEKEVKDKMNASVENIVTLSKKKTKKMESFYIIVILVLLLAVGYAYFTKEISFFADKNHVQRNIEVSEVFNDKEINDAMDLVIEDFERNFHGCILKELSYSDDKYLNLSQSWAENYHVEKAIVIGSVFEVEKEGASSTLNAGTTYTWYNWVLTYTNGKWVIRDRGY